MRVLLIVSIGMCIISCSNTIDEEKINEAIIRSLNINDATFLQEIVFSDTAIIPRQVLGYNITKNDSIKLDSLVSEQVLINHSTNLYQRFSIHTNYDTTFERHENDLQYLYINGSQYRYGGITSLIKGKISNDNSTAIDSLLVLESSLVFIKKNRSFNPIQDLYRKKLYDLDTVYRKIGIIYNPLTDSATVYKDLATNIITNKGELRQGFIYKDNLDLREINDVMSYDIRNQIEKQLLASPNIERTVRDAWSYKDTGALFYKAIEQLGLSDSIKLHPSTSLTKDKRVKTHEYKLNGNFRSKIQSITFDSLGYTIGYYIYPEGDVVNTNCLFQALTEKEKKKNLNYIYARYKSETDSLVMFKALSFN